MRTLILTAAILTLVACASKKAAVSITDSDVQKAAAKYPGATLTSLQQGKTLYEENCGKCHSLKSPSAYNEEQWGKHVKRMAPKAKIDKATEELILQYVVTMSGK